MRYTPAQEQALTARPVVGMARLASGAERLVALAQEQLGLTATVLTELQAGTLVIRQAAGDVDAFGMRPGLEISLSETYCARIAEGGGPQVVRDAQRERRGRTSALAGRAEVGAYVAVPVILPNGDLYGTLCCLSRRAEPGLSVGDVRMLGIIAGILAEDLELAGRTTQAHKLKHDRLRGLLTGEGLSIVLQPIVELAGGRVVAVEALSRFNDEPGYGPDRLFADAAALGLGVELELLAIRRALEHLDGLPPGVRLSVNGSPTTLCTSELQDLLAAISGDRLAIEITEHAPVDDYTALRVALTRLRSRGVQLMVDDAGAGFASLKHIVDLQPDVIKLDVSLTRDIDTDPLRRALAASLLAFASEIGASIIAEGIETYGELEALRALGVRHGQGYLLARPGPGPVPHRVAVAGPRTLVDAA
jgi:EAL domain-containing protein (putative c-di-GMP-specific phosphodiesterase class I)